MPGKKILQKKPEFYKAWKNFIEKGEIDQKLLRPIIVESWLRSKKYGVDPKKMDGKNKLSKEQLEKRFNKLSKLIRTSQPFMSSLYKIVENSGFIVRLADNEGYILGVKGDEDILNSGRNLNISLGDNCSEKTIGTNAIGTALATGKPLQVFAAEHYCEQYHTWTSSACPLKDTNGEIIGVLSMTGHYDKVHPHTLGMVVAAAEAIENQMKVDETNRQLAIANKHFLAIMESMSEGLLSIDEHAIITDINLAARNLLGIEEKDIIGKHIRRLFNVQTKKILSVLKQDRGFSEEEMFLETKKRGSIGCIVTSTPIHDENDKVAGAVIVLREMKNVRKLVNKIAGSEARFTFNDILGQSEKLQEAIQLAKIAARNTSTVLLCGESGTGKEMFAQAIHNSSLRREGPFVFLNCGAIPRELVASELFGYVEGAFTGAKRGGHPGKFELADGGTIFLDEIGDMPLDTQVNLLRVLESKQIMRIGGEKVIPVNVRVIAATNKKLEDEVLAGNFRQDLFYRLNVTPIKIPPLRERKEDIPILIDHFTQKLSKTLGKEITKIEDKFYRAMMSYSWPGNVRELQNVLQQAINLCDGEVLRAEHIPVSIKPNHNQKTDIPIHGILTLEEVEERAIITALKACKGNISKAAESLGIGRNTLYRKMKKYSIKNVL
ncbi:MAG: sigma-54 dependent transcriptional regulator, acetoin dehydrogenase operon transcriptional [Thermosediminibacterales bacterium]|nr:sigma-54 dependent transcriptional regulator, acetoin dehydrogenase operon transcriptional [Thermosediminibacterales bacterium]